MDCMNNPVIFISYHHSDREKATCIYNFLLEEYEEQNIFFDLNKHSLLPGDEWEKKIVSSIKLSTHFLVVITKTTVKEIERLSFFQYEIFIALQHYSSFSETSPFDNFNIIPVFTDTDISSDLLPEPRLSVYQSLKFQTAGSKNTSLLKLKPVSTFHSFSHKRNKEIKDEIEYLKRTNRNRNIIIYGPSLVGKSKYIDFIFEEDQDLYGKEQDKSFKLSLSKDPNISSPFEQYQDKLNKCSTILLDEFNKNYEKDVECFMNKETIFICQKLDDISKDFLKECIIYEMKFWDVNEVATNIFSSFFTDIDRAKTVSKICGGRPHIVDIFVSLFKKKNNLKTIVKKAINLNKDNFNALKEKYDPEYKKIIDAIATLIS